MGREKPKDSKLIEEPCHFYGIDIHDVAYHLCEACPLGQIQNGVVPKCRGLLIKPLSPPEPPGYTIVRR